MSGTCPGRRDRDAGIDKEELGTGCQIRRIRNLDPTRGVSATSIVCGSSRARATKASDGFKIKEKYCGRGRVPRKPEYRWIRKTSHSTPEPERTGNANIYSRSSTMYYITLVAASSMDPEIRAGLVLHRDSQQVGELLAQKAKAKGIENVVFDRGGYRYHGKVKALSEGARSGGLKF